MYQLGIVVHNYHLGIQGAKARSGCTETNQSIRMMYSYVKSERTVTHGVCWVEAAKSSPTIA